MKQSPDVSFIIPSYRSRATLGATLDSIERQSTDSAVEVIVVDSSGDQTAAWLRREYPRVRALQSETRLWPGQARNLGVEQSRGQWLAFVDADVVLEPDWLESMLKALRVPGRRLVGGWVANANPQTAASRVLHWIEFSEYLSGLPSRDCSVLSSSNWLMRRETFLGTGGFTNDPVFSEDSLFCRTLGNGIHFEGVTGVHHRFREGWPEVNDHLRVLGYWSGRYRASQRVAGSGLARLPQLAYLLLPYRALLICRRVARSSSPRRSGSLLLLPWLVRGLWHWTRGFRRGLG